MPTLDGMNDFNNAPGTGDAAPHPERRAPAWPVVKDWEPAERELGAPIEVRWSTT